MTIFVNIVSYLGATPIPYLTVNVSPVAALAAVFFAITVLLGAVTVAPVGTVKVESSPVLVTL